MAAEASVSGLVDAALTLSGGVLDEGHHAAGHEAAAPHGVAGPGHLRDLDDTTSGGDLDASPRSCGLDLEALDTAGAGIHQDLDPITLHRDTDATAIEVARVAPMTPTR